MSFIAELGSINSLLGGAAALVRELKRPRMTQQDFSALLQAQLQQAGNPALAQMRQARAAADFTMKHINLHDVTGDGRLSVMESGFDAPLFEAMDINRDGLLDAQEVYQAALRQLRAPAPPMLAGG
jgi:hypothetical protein